MKEFTNTWTCVKKERKTRSAWDDHFGLTARYVREQSHQVEDLKTLIRHFICNTFQNVDKKVKPKHCHLFTAINS